MIHTCLTEDVPRDVSDHRLVKLTFQCLPTTTDELSSPSPTPEIATFNFKDADTVKFRAALSRTDWRRILPTDVPSMHHHFLQALTAAARHAAVPTYNLHRATPMDRDLNALNQRRSNYHVLLQRGLLSATLRRVYTGRLTALTAQILARTKELRELAERRAIAQLRTDPKLFYHYAEGSC